MSSIIRPITSNITPCTARRPTTATVVNLIFFSPQDNTKEELLYKIDEHWRDGTLFKKAGEPNANFYSRYTEELRTVVDLNEDYFALFPKSDSSKYNFRDEFISLSENGDLTLLQRALILTQALELALLGVDPSSVLASINQNVTSSGDHAKGFRNELLAGWFLAKFIYQLDPQITFKFTHQDMLPTFSRDDRSKVVRQPYRREVDIHTEDALVSVKSNKNNFPRQIRDLFFIVTDSIPIGGDLKDKIKTLILIKTAEDKEQFSPHFKQTNRYKKIKDETIAEARKAIEEFQFPTQYKEAFLTCYRELVSNHGINIYFLPFLDCAKDLKDWIEKNYEAMDEIVVSKPTHFTRRGAS